jgi:4,5-DOPA dioxygenase extradiol
MARLPALFVSHGSPMTALADDAYTHALEAFGATLPTPEAIVVVSAHWQAPWPVRVTVNARPPLIYDFGGFPPPLYRLTYPAPGAPELAARIVAALERDGVPAAADPTRGLDHGVWVPLRRLRPAADVPVVAVSLPEPAPPADLGRIGAALAPLRERGVLLVGSGGIVHNLARLGADGGGPPAWAREFDDWVRGRLAARDDGALQGYRAAVPSATLAAPTTEHLDPLFVVLGSAGPAERVVDVFEGFVHGSLSLRTFALAN